ncbi:MAG: hypothetical protein M1457_06400, partial [bacterium]|nr:hypothetical protein [bacterium]
TWSDRHSSGVPPGFRNVLRQDDKAAALNQAVICVTGQLPDPSSNQKIPTTEMTRHQNIDGV